MEHYVGIGVSLELSSVCVVDGRGKIVKEAKVASEPEARRMVRRVTPSSFATTGSGTRASLSCIGLPIVARYRAVPLRTALGLFVSWRD